MYRTIESWFRDNVAPTHNYLFVIIIYFIIYLGELSICHSTIRQLTRSIPKPARSAFDPRKINNYASRCCNSIERCIGSQTKKLKKKMKKRPIFSYYVKLWLHGRKMYSNRPISRFAADNFWDCVSCCEFVCERRICEKRKRRLKAKRDRRRGNRVSEKGNSSFLFVSDFFGNLRFFSERRDNKTIRHRIKWKVQRSSGNE